MKLTKCGSKNCTVILPFNQLDDDELKVENSCVHLIRINISNIYRKFKKCFSLYYYNHDVEKNYGDIFKDIICLRICILNMCVKMRWMF